MPVATAYIIILNIFLVLFDRAVKLSKLISKADKYTSVILIIISYSIEVGSFGNKINVVEFFEGIVY